MVSIPPAANEALHPKAAEASSSGSIKGEEKISPVPSYEREPTTANESADLETGNVKYGTGVEEKAMSESEDGTREPPAETSKIRRLWNKFKPFIFPIFWVVMTGWWIAGLVLHRKDRGWLIPFLLWLFLTIRLVTLYVPAKYALIPVAFIWNKGFKGPSRLIPEKLRTPLAGAGTIAVFIVGTFASEESDDNTRANRAVSLFGLAVFIFAFWITSKKRSAIQWQTVIVGMLSQYILALFVLRTKAGYDIFNFIAFLAKSLLGYARDGTMFLTSEDALNTFGWFLLNVIPPIIFFIAFVQLLYFWGWLQWFIKKFATVFFYTMKVSGAEAVVAAASPFVGQGESAMLIKPFIPHLTEAELHQVMTSGFATIAGSVLAAYIQMGINPLALISSCVMSIPASLAISKLRYPETEEPLTAGKIIIPEDTDEKPTNGLHAFANGSWLGLKIGSMIAACLLTILALLGLVNGLLGWWGRYLSIETDIGGPKLTIQLIFGYLFYPISFLLGVDRNGGDILKVSQLIGIKIVANEFVAFAELMGNSYLGISQRSRLIATYACCGFGNISSVGIQIGVLSQLAPGRSGRVAKVALSALISGVIATLTSASIAGMLIVDQSRYVLPTESTAA
ncbi:Na+ dependent nucleoside transporter C-terminus-domain-containing protein [Bisporella sp. PMI_857]|nr:Na+ dependent nucleoside transporter C-terminus-domain-containing protein [Bisporella sp. PMI_857]